MKIVGYEINWLQPVLYCAVIDYLLPRNQDEEELLTEYPLCRGIKK